VTESPNPSIADPDALTGDTAPIRRCVLALGSNLGERLASLQGAVDSLADTPCVWVTAVSPVYETEPVGGPPGAQDFYNAVVLADTTLTAHTLLERAMAIEDAFGRERTGVPGSPRTLDVDLITVGGRHSHDATLTLPHPLAHRRGFVLAPWCDVDPEAVLPDHGPVARLLDEVGRDGIHRRDDLVLYLR
jgi:2-amino-4-hydroxy-6-hydroxymethyldihydropteridine diphosphokinase